MPSSQNTPLAKSSSTSSFRSFSRNVTRYYRYGRQVSVPCELQHNENDIDLWNPAGDCTIYIDDSTAISTAFRLSSSVLREHNASFLLNNLQSIPRDQRGQESPHTDSYEIHVDIPSSLSADEIVEYHFTTRNYFACLLDKPVIGISLGQAIRDVSQRIRSWHAAADNVDMILQYCQKQGYTSFTNQPMRAVAMLAFAESVRSRSLWIDAFAHCVAMQDRIALDSGYDSLPKTTRALITKAALELEMYLPKVTQSVGTLLESELSAENIGLSKPARDHLDHFRGFLFDFLAEKWPSFPPSSADSYDRLLWREVHDDFQALYDYLVDLEASNDSLGDRGVIGGVCVYQNVDVFNQKHNFDPLPHPLPRLPDLRLTKRVNDVQSGTVMGFMRTRTESEVRPSARQALKDASNSNNAQVLDRPIVQEFIDFEGQRLEEKLSVAEARKIRWLLIYCTLQMLKSIVLAPAEVKDANAAPYPLCIRTVHCPIDVPPIAHSRSLSINSSRNSFGLAGLSVPRDDSDRISIHPDCEAENATDFFLARRSSVAEKSEGGESPIVARGSPGPMLSRSLSIRTSVSSTMNALQKSVIGSLSRRNSSRNSVQPVAKKMPSLQDVGFDEEEEDDDDDAEEDEEEGTPDDEIDEDEDEGESEEDVQKDDERAKSAQDQVFDQCSPLAGLLVVTEKQPSVSFVPMLEDYQLDMLTSADHTPLLDEQMSPISDRSRRDSMRSDSSTPPTEASSRSNSYRESKLLGMLAPLEEDSVLMTRRDRPSRPTFSTSSSMASLNAGCYAPSGIKVHDAPLSKFAAPQRRHVYERRQDVEGTASGAGSFTPHSPGSEKSRPLHNRYGRARGRLADEQRFTWGDLP